MFSAIKWPFRMLWRGWKKFAHVLGIVNTHVLLTVTYYVIFAVAFVGTRLARMDLLDRRMDPRPSYYHPCTPVKATLESARRQF